MIVLVIKLRNYRLINCK